MSHQHHHIDYVELSATDIPSTKAFYASAFGWTFTDYGPDYVAFDDSGTSGGFRRVASNATGGPFVILYSSALEATRFHFLDPNGNELAVWSDK
jgi:predicted enzyme related to lactoylglutathione lyase